MSKTAFVVSVTDELGDVERAMEAHQVRRLPVVNEDGQLVGVMSMGDLVHAWRCAALSASEVGSAVSAIFVTKQVPPIAATGSRCRFPDGRRAELYPCPLAAVLGHRGWLAAS